MRDQLRTPVGEDIVAATLRGGVQTRGVLIDNPSGSWLFVTPFNDYVAPYKLGWARSLQSGTLAVGVLFQDGPSGQVSTRRGDPVTLWLDSEPVGSSAGADSGAAFVERFTPVLRWSLDTTIPVNGLAGVLGPFAAVAGRRYRLLTITASYSATLGFSTDKHSASPINIILDDTSPANILNISLFPAAPYIPLVFDNGLDLAPGLGINATIVALWANEALQLQGTYQVL